MVRAGFVTLVAALLIGTLLYYTLHRLDSAEAFQRERQASQAAQQQAVAVSRLFASLSASVLPVNAAKLQQLHSGAWHVEGLSDTMVIGPGGLVLAASNPAYVGQQMQDGGWASIRTQNREWVFLDEPVPGQERVTVFEPVTDKGATIAWARLSFLRARGDMPVRTPEERLQLVAWLLIPLSALLAGLVLLVMRLATAQMQQQIKSVVAEAMADAPSVSGEDEARQAEEPMVGAGTHRAA